MQETLLLAFVLLVTKSFRFLLNINHTLKSDFSSYFINVVLGIKTSILFRKLAFIWTIPCIIVMCSIIILHIFSINQTYNATIKVQEKLPTCVQCANDETMYSAKIFFSNSIFRKNAFIALIDYKINSSNIDKYEALGTSQRNLTFKSRKSFDVGDEIGSISYGVRVLPIVYAIPFILYLCGILLYILCTIFVSTTIFYRSNIFICLSIITSLLMLSGYFAVGFIGIIFALVTIYGLLKKDDVAGMKYIYIIVFIISALLNIVFYSKYYRVFYDYQAKAASSNINLQYIQDNFIDIVVLVVGIIYDKLGIVLFVCLAFITLIIMLRKFFIGFNSQCISSHLALIFSLSAIIWMFAVMIVTPMKNIRYIMPVFPIILLIFPYVFKFLLLQKSLLKLFFIPVMLVCVANTTYFALDSRKIEFLNSGYRYNTRYFNIDDNVLIYTPSVWKSFTIIPYLSNKNYYFINDCDRLKSILNTNLMNHNFTKLIIEKEPQCFPLSNVDSTKVVDLGYYYLLYLSKL